MFDWKSRISKNDKFIDLQGMPYYDLKWDESPEVVDIYGLDVKIPVAPEDSMCVNHGMDEHDQIFRRTLIPEPVLYPHRDFGREGWTRQEIEAFIDAEWSRRRNGMWMFIKGKKTYIPGLLYMKMNYWKNNKNEEFIYKDTDRKFFMAWLHCLYDPSCVGIADYKCRQVGDTENVILIMWEYGSRVRGTMNALQSCINENHAEKTYNRLVHGHKQMPYWFKPLNQGTEDPKKGLKLKYPAQHITHASVREKAKKGQMVNRSSAEDYEFPEIGSEFYFGPTKSNHFDGTTLGRAYLDEFGKSDGKINPVEWIQVIKEAIYSNITGKKKGMIIMTSTVEEIGVDSLDWAMTIWKESDPSKRTDNGTTTNGLFRIFRNVVERGEVDRWGFPLEEKIIAHIKSTYEAMIKAGNIHGAMSFIRKNPITIDDVFLSAANESQFHVENLKKREFYLTEVAHPKPWVKGNLKWKDGQMDTEVIWEPNPNGKWLISKHPEDFGLQKNYKVTNLVAPKPGNQYHFSMGVDPIEQEDTLDKDPSKGAIAVFKNLDDLVDRDESKRHQHGDDIAGIQAGDPVAGGEYFDTHRFVCTYCERPEDPNVFFEDTIMTAVYYGTAFLPEKNKFHAMHTYLKLRNHALYLMDKPTDVKNYRGQQEKDGVTATTNSIDMYFSFLQTFTVKWANTIDHPDLCTQLASMNWKNRGKRDLGVAAGWALYQSYQPRGKRKETRVGTEAVRHFHENLV